MLQNLRERQGSKIYKLLGERMPNWQIVSETIFVLPPLYFCFLVTKISFEGRTEFLSWHTHFWT